MSADEYTPTADEVRVGYVDFRGQTSWALPREAEAEFDRWLAAHEAEIRERIAHEIEDLIASETDANGPHPGEGERDAAWLTAARLVRKGGAS